MMRIFQKKWLVIWQNWTKFTQRASKSRRKNGSAVVEMEGKIVFVRKKGKRKFGKNNRALTISKKDWNLSLPSR